MGCLSSFPSKLCPSPRRCTSMTFVLLLKRACSCRPLSTSSGTAVNARNAKSWANIGQGINGQLSGLRERHFNALTLSLLTRKGFKSNVRLKKDGLIELKWPLKGRQPFESLVRFLTGWSEVEDDVWQLEGSPAKTLVPPELKF